jgi:uncharacterized damage-inducible protein DinB
MSANDERGAMDVRQDWRAGVAAALDWHEAHARFDDAVRDLAPALRGKRPDGFPHSPWELVEHIRRTQADLIDFCRNSNYRELDWPKDYWPLTPAPPHDRAWDESIAAYEHDRAELKRMTTDPSIELTTPIAHGSGQTVLREILLAIDHASYHVGQLIAVRRLLGAWK